jgi:uncharacterized protein YdeI (YjbR/CyaY-like superfamily)
MDPEPIFFDGPEGFREWLAANHETASEVVVGFYKKATGKQTMTWSQAVDQALCFGWIDGKVKRIDDERHQQRFTPRRPGSNWSRVNLEKVARLEADGLMEPAGRAAFERRRDEATGVYSFERGEPAELPAEFARRLAANDAASRHFASRPLGYRRSCLHWVTSAKREKTRVRRMDQLIESSERGEDAPPFRSLR